MHKRVSYLLLLLSASVPLAAESRVKVAELSPQAEAAIDRGIEFIARHQNENGSWGSYHFVAETALSLMSFMVKGYFPGRPPHGEVMDKGVDFLVRSAQATNGYMGKSMYEHGLATLALSEVWGMSNKEEIRDTLKAAVNIILRSQNREGGWRYKPQPIDADLSVTVMQIVALASAKEAGILVSDAVIKNALTYVKRCQKPFDGGFGYTPGGKPGFARTAAGVMSLMMCGERGTRAVKSGLYYLQNLPEEKFTVQKHYFYGHYYAIQAMYQAGEGHYQEWYPHIRDALLSKQGRDGSWHGSAGSVYGTSMAILIMGVPYRFLPIYQR